MHTLARTSRWLMVNRDRNRERLAKVIEQRDAAQARARRRRPREPGGARVERLGAPSDDGLRRGAYSRPRAATPRVCWLWFRRCRATWSRAVRDSSGPRWSTRCWPRACEVVGVDAFTDYYPRDRKEAAIATARSDPAFELIEHDLGGRPHRPRRWRGSRAIFHLAARPGVRASWGDGFEPYLHDNVLATHKIAECAARRGLRLVFASSSSVYGDALAYPTREDAQPAPVSPYGVTKLTCEHLLRAHSRNFGLDYVALRYFTVYGPRQRPDMAFARMVGSAGGGHRLRGVRRRPPVA